VYQTTKDEMTNIEKRVAYAGRVEFSCGTLTHNAGTLPPTPLAILSSPKPTTTRFYLKPKNGIVPAKWTTNNGYDDDTVLRGRKFYRHHGVAREDEYYRAGGRCDDQNRTVRDALVPGARFEFTVRFENLTPVELGALLWTLEMDQHSVHRLGFAKPLGFGSVKIRISQLEVLDPAKRYTSLSEPGWYPAKDWQTTCVQAFKQALAKRYGATNFESLAHVQDLQALLSDHTNGLPIHYPRTARRADPEGRNFEWFMGNNRHQGYALAPATEDRGLPLMTRDGTEVK
jgi:CRISPR-associated protein (TIGR03986 family)